MHQAPHAVRAPAHPQPEADPAADLQAEGRDHLSILSIYLLPRSVPPLSIYLSICPFVPYMSIYVSVYLSLCLSLSLYIYIYRYMYIYIYTHT